MKRLAHSILWFFLLVVTQVEARQPGLNEAEYRQLSPVFELMEQFRWDDARQQLLRAEQRVSSDYGRAFIYHNLAQIALQQAQYPSAIGYLKQAKALAALPAQQMQSIQHTLGQLYCGQAQWQRCIDEINQWRQEPGVKVRPEDHLLLAQAYAQLSRWRALLPHIDLAIRARNPAPERWYQLQIGAHIQLKQWNSAVAQQQKLIQHYADQPRHWRQLVTLQLRQGDEKQALATQRLGYERQLLRSRKDYRLLAQLMLNQQLPYLAGEVLQAGLDGGVLRADRKTLDLLANAWIRAKENKQAIVTMTRLYRQVPSERYASRLAQLQLNAKQWRSAEQLLVKVLQGKPDNPAQLQLMLGIARVNLKQYDAARKAFDDAATVQRYSQSVAGWVRYLEQLEAASERQG